MMRPKTMQALRRYHLYVGMIFAPAIIFFSFSGAIQTIGWQDDPAPPAWIKTIASIHKKQTMPKARKPRPQAAAPAPAPASEGGAAARREEPAAQGPSPIPLKIFTVLLSIGLILSAGLGVAIALANRSTRRMSTIMLAIGLILPPLLLLV
jgi:hypothetical protein